MNRPLSGSAVLLGAALLTLTTSGTPAQAAGNGSVTTTISGVPSRVGSGGSFEITITARSSSNSPILVDGLYIGMWQRSGGAAEGVTLQWQNPSTGQWQGAEPAHGDGWSLSGRGLATVAPHGTLVTHARISMGGAAAGGYGLSSNGVSAYELLGPSGDPIAGHLDSVDLAQAFFAYGSGGASAPTTPAAAPTHSTPPASAGHATRTADAPSPSDTEPAAEQPAPTPTATSDTATPSASASPGDTPAPTPSGSAAATAVAGTAGSGSAVPVFAFGGAAVLAGAAVGGVVLLRRRRDRRELPLDG